MGKMSFLPQSSDSPFETSHVYDCFLVFLTPVCASRCSDIRQQDNFLNGHHILPRCRHCAIELPLTSSLFQPYELGIIMISMLQMQKLRLWATKKLAQVHIAGKQRGSQVRRHEWGLEPGCLFQSCLSYYGRITHYHTLRGLWELCTFHSVFQ